MEISHIIRDAAMHGFMSLLGTVLLFLLFTYAVISMEDGALRNSIIGGLLAALMFLVYGGGL